MASADPSTRPVRPALLTERGRYHASFGLATLPALAVVVPLVLTGRLAATLTAVVVWLITIYGFSLLAYSVLTVHAFSRDLAGCTALDPTPPRAFGRTRSALRPGAPMAVTYSAISMAAAVWLAVSDGSRGLPASAVLTALLVVSAWVCMLVTYAADYAQRQSRTADLDFPGTVTGFADHLYFSMSVSTTFGSTDVTVTSTAMRRTVLTHGLVAFVFNTVVVALLVSTLLS